MTKQDVIKAAYGKHWSKVKDHINEDGFVKFGNGRHKMNIGGVDWDIVGYDKVSVMKTRVWWLWRPKTLDGLEDNNGWIKTEDSLPSKIGTYRVCVEGRLSIANWTINDLSLDMDYFKKVFSHWMPIKHPQPPLY